MEPTIFFAVIAAAAMHAGWNAVLKIKLDPLLAAVLIAAGGGILALPTALWLGLPATASLPYLAASIILHFLYYITLTGAYRLADMSEVYPVARGSAPLMTALISLIVFREAISWLGISGVAVLALGIMLIALRSRAFNRKALVLALACGVTITSYTLVDGHGARASGDPHAYTAWLFVLDGIALVAYVMIRQGRNAIRPLASFALPGLAGGAMSLASYWIAIWAMTKAPIGLVAAVRESSVLFGILIAIFVLRESVTPNRILAAVMILTGLVMIRLG